MSETAVAPSVILLASSLTLLPYTHIYGHMKTTIELPDALLRRAKVLAAQRDTTLRELVIEGLQHITGSGGSHASPRLTGEEPSVATIGEHGLPVLRRASPTKRPVTRALVERLREELGT